MRLMHTVSNLLSTALIDVDWYTLSACWLVEEAAEASVIVPDEIIYKSVRIT